MLISEDKKLCETLELFIVNVNSETLYRNVKPNLSNQKTQRTLFVE